MQVPDTQSCWCCPVEYLREQIAMSENIMTFGYVTSGKVC